MQTRSVPQPGWSFEYIMWIFTRISGLAMVGLAFLGLIGALLMGARTQLDLPTLLRWTFFPNPNHVVNSNIPDVTLGWANAYWQIMQMLIVFFGISHGCNGFRVVVEDYTGNTIVRPMMRGAVFVVWLFLLIVAIFVILSS
jgi:succinate dehydrogenase / fumarate reductase, membrane anchor subunit